MILAAVDAGRSLLLSLHHAARCNVQVQ
jgi:hypothetical protein